MQVFYNEYDEKIRDGQVTEAERQLFKGAVKDLNALTDKNTENIKLLAGELSDSQETLGTFDSKVNQLQTFLGEQMTATEKSFQDQSYQFRKLSQDLFDAIGMRETEDQFEQRLDKQKNYYEGVISELNSQIDEKLKKFDPAQTKRDLQNFVYNTYDERQNSITQELMTYMQRLMSMNNLGS